MERGSRTQKTTITRVKPEKKMRCNMQNGEREQNTENNYYKGETRKKRWDETSCRGMQIRRSERRKQKSGHLAGHLVLHRCPRIRPIDDVSFIDHCSQLVLRRISGESQLVLRRMIPIYFWESRFLGVNPGYWLFDRLLCSLSFPVFQTSHIYTISFSLSLGSYCSQCRFRVRNLVFCFNSRQLISYKLVF